MDARLRQAIKSSFERQTMMATLGAELGDIRPGRVDISAPILSCARQQHGYAHAGLTFALGDSAAGYAALSVMPHGSEVLTAEIKIHLLAPAAGDRIIARGRVIKPGRRLVVVASDVFAQAGSEERLVATLLGTMVPVHA